MPVTDKASYWRAHETIVLPFDYLRFSLSPRGVPESSRQVFFREKHDKHIADKKRAFRCLTDHPESDNPEMKEQFLELEKRVTKK
jgi:hypothetical protein